MALPTCGLYRTTKNIGSVPAGKLVYFHNHGDPGPGVYLPSGWQANRAQFSEHGHTLENDSQAGALEQLQAEGFYRVSQDFTCCDKQCRTYQAETLVQLGYNANAEAILFVPNWTAAGLELPERGQRISRDRTELLVALRVSSKNAPQTALH